MLIRSQKMKESGNGGDDQGQEMSVMESEDRPLTLRNLISVCIILIFGCALSTICFLLEMLLFNLSGNKVVSYHRNDYKKPFSKL